jgi:Fe-S-cluster containining protein
VWRRFSPRFFARAAEHVHEGGLAAIVPEVGPVVVLLGAGPGGEIEPLAEWAMLAIDARSWQRVLDGPAAGLYRAEIGPDYDNAVCDWCERDGGHPGPTRAIDLDCRECGVCCRDADVIVASGDVERWHAAGRADLAAPAYLDRDGDGQVHLRFVDRRCQHLGAERNTCAIYELRPDNCRAFVMGSEACLSAREDTLGIRDDGTCEREPSAPGS